MSAMVSITSFQLCNIELELQKLKTGCFLKLNNILARILEAFLKTSWKLLNYCCIYIVYIIYYYLRITWLIECVGYLYQILLCENMFICKAFLVSVLILKLDFSSIWVFSFSCSYKNVSGYTTRQIKNRGK